MSRDYVLQPFQSAVHLQIDYTRELNEQQCAAGTEPPGTSKPQKSALRASRSRRSDLAG